MIVARCVSIVLVAALAVPAPAATPETGGLAGRVDSALLGSVTPEVVVLRPDAADASAGVVASAPVTRATGTCEWRYAIPILATGEYRLGLRSGTSDLRPLGSARVEPGRVTIADLRPASVIQVGPQRRLRRPSEAAATAGDGAVVEIDAAVYAGDVAVWRQNGLTLRGVGGYAQLNAAGRYAEGKAIWVIKGRNVRVEHVEFSGAKVPDGNGAGIRHEGEDLTICDGYFHHNQNGILGGGGEVLIEHSEFAYNGAGDGYTHNLYITERARKFTLRHSYSHHVHVGHLVKSRARVNFLLYNRLMDEAEGNSSYAIDLPDGGIGYVIGNIIQQGPHSENHSIIALGAEKAQGSDADRFYLINNTLVNDHSAGTFVSVKPGARVNAVNNIFAGPGQLFRGVAEMRANLALSNPGFVDRAAYDYRLVARSAARDAGSEPGQDGDVALRPTSQYAHKARAETRPRFGPLDIGAYEYVAGESSATPASRPAAGGSETPSGLR